MSGANRQRVLICDDDELIVASLRGLFLLETDYELLEFTNPVEAAQEVARRPVDLVISDFLMPEMNGVEFLGKVRQAQPDAVRSLLTGFADKENAIRAINEVGLYHYLEKPWDNENLLLLVRNALREKSLRGQLSDLIAEYERLIAQHRSLSDRHASVEREMEMAARVQQSLLPHEPPQIDGFRVAWTFLPSSALGGDFYDVAQSETMTVILLADVSGHGIQAALTSMLLKASFQEAARAAETPGDLLETMNGRLHRFLPSGIYACAGLICIGSNDGRMVVANAGLPHPRVVRSSGSVDELPLDGIPLGMMAVCPQSLRDQADLEMVPDDLLIFATDGLGEACNGAGDSFETSGLEEELVKLKGAAPDAAVQALADQAVAFDASESLVDDLTIIAVQRSSR
jgi:serine phosphatase RsbU (regulator of sigma subunit)